MEGRKTVKRRLKSGRPRKLTSHEERLLVRYVKDDPRRTSIDVKKMASEEMGKEISYDRQTTPARQKPVGQTSFTEATHVGEESEGSLCICEEIQKH